MAADRQQYSPGHQGSDWQEEAEPVRGQTGNSPSAEIQRLVCSDANNHNVDYY